MRNNFILVNDTKTDQRVEHNFTLKRFYGESGESLFSFC